MTACAEFSMSQTLMLHVWRVTRLEDRSLGEHDFSSDELEDLAAKHVGFFAGGFPSVERMLRPLLQLSKSGDARSWCVAFSSKDCLRSATNSLRVSGGEPRLLAGQLGWRLGNLNLVTVEGLSRRPTDGTRGLILIDPACHVHKARQFRTWNGRNHDRPQIIIDFLADAAAAGSPSAFFIFTLKPPKSLPTLRIADIYARTTWQFLDPLSIRFWERGAVQSSVS